MQNRQPFAATAVLRPGVLSLYDPLRVADEQDAANPSHIDVTLDPPCTPRPYWNAESG